MKELGYKSPEKEQKGNEIINNLSPDLVAVVNTYINLNEASKETYNALIEIDTLPGEYKQKAKEFIIKGKSPEESYAIVMEDDGVIDESKRNELRRKMGII